MITLRQRWMLALGAVFHQREGRSHVRLGGLARSWPNQLTCARELLSGWNVHDAAEARKALSIRPRASARGRSPIDDPSRGFRLAYDAGRYCLLAGYAFAVGHITETEAWAFLARVSREVQSEFGSFAELGAAFLMGEALHTGSWDGRDERAYHELLAREDSPWRALPWDLSLKDGAISGDSPLELWAFDLTVFFSCPTCKAFVAADRLVAELPCVGCGVSFSPSRNAWVQTLAAKIDEVRRMPIGHVHRSFAAGNDYDATSRWVRVAPTCPGCDAPIALGDLLGRRKGCSACGAGLRGASSDSFLAEVHPEIVGVAGERTGGASRKSARRTPLFVQCTGCGAPLRPESDRRLVTCTHCRKTEELADEIWRVLVPPPPIPTLRIVLGSLRSRSAPSQRRSHPVPPTE